VLLRPDREEIALIANLTGLVLIGLGLVMLGPAVLALVWREPNEAAGFVIGACVAILPGLAIQLRAHRAVTPLWAHGMVTAAVSWLIAPFVAAIPLFLSGHYASYLDAYFDAMSGFATAGLAVINDLDHLARSVNLWRHVTQFMGGQGLILVMLSLFPTNQGATGMYIGEGREDRIMPNVVHTVRFIWQVSLTWLLVGSLALWAALVRAGMPVGEGLFHAVTLFMAAFDTGGFAPTSAGIGLYHSPGTEAVIAVLMVAGCFSFALHAHLWRRQWGAGLRDTELRALVLSIVALFGLVAVGLATFGTYDTVEGMLRRGLFHLVSAHTGTGFNNVPGRFFVTQWGALAPAGIVLAMAFGGMAGSTSGGIKLIRLAVATKAVRGSIRATLLPTDAVSLEFLNRGHRSILREPTIRSAFMILLLYLALYAVGGAVGLFYGYPFTEALFESTSAAAAVGLSVGITGPTMENGLEIVYILQMWLGRLEFIAALSLIGFVWSAVRGRV
jgi:trk system potassium uptake protein TrkH